MKNTAFLLALVWCGLVPPAASADELQAEQINAVTAEIGRHLRDPSSAEFSEIYAAKQSTGESIVCGSVNAKNGFGGYSGALPFIGKLYGDGLFYVTQIARDAAEATNVRGLCKSYGITLST